MRDSSSVFSEKPSIFVIVSASLLPLKINSPRKKKCQLCEKVKEAESALLMGEKGEGEAPLSLPRVPSCRGCDLQWSFNQLYLNGAVYLLRKSIVVLAAMRSLDTALRLP